MTLNCKSSVNLRSLNLDGAPTIKAVVGGIAEHISRRPAVWMSATLIVLFTIAFYRTAWIAEDAFITFRSVENVLAGYGPVWNVAERVQTFTHPLWFALLVPGVALFGDVYWVALVLSYICLAVLVMLLCSMAARRGIFAYAVLATLLFSRAFVDYSSSGLENPATHVLLVLFAFVWLRFQRSPFQTFALTLLFSLLYLNRPDSVVLVAPAIAWRFWEERRLWPIAFGAVPMVAWILFSLFYYGSPVPNTALAKLGGGIDAATRVLQAVAYIDWTAKLDAISLALIGGAIVLGLREKVLRPLLLGVVSWIVYLFYAGADYMGGRFFSGAVVLSVCVLMHCNWKWLGRMTVAVLLVASPQLAYTLGSPSTFKNHALYAGIADERGFYYQALGMVPTLYEGRWDRHRWFKQGKSLRPYPGIYTRCAIGMSGYAGGPGVYWLDPLALADPFLSRLPARSGTRVGHYERALPPGYLESLVSGENRLVSPSLANLYRDVTLATRAPLLDGGRWGAIYRLNTGKHKIDVASFDREAIGLPGISVEVRSALSCYGIPYGWSPMWRLHGDPVRAQRVVDVTTPGYGLKLREARKQMAGGVDAASANLFPDPVNE